jgi:DnaJ-class molecular chaperone
VIRHDEELIVRGEGMPIRGTGRKGDLYVKFAVEMPGESWASRQDVVHGVSGLAYNVKTRTDSVEHQSRAAGPIARDVPTAGKGRYLFPCASA